MLSLQKRERQIHRKGFVQRIPCQVCVSLGKHRVPRLRLIFRKRNIRLRSG